MLEHKINAVVSLVLELAHNYKFNRHHQLFTLFTMTQSWPTPANPHLKRLLCKIYRVISLTSDSLMEAEQKAFCSKCRRKLGSTKTLSLCTEAPT